MQRGCSGSSGSISFSLYSDNDSDSSYEQFVDIENSATRGCPVKSLPGIEVYTCHCEYDRGFLQLEVGVGFTGRVNLMQSHQYSLLHKDERVMFPLDRVQVFWDPMFEVAGDLAPAHLLQQFKYINQRVHGDMQETSSMYTMGILLLHTDHQPASEDEWVTHDMVSELTGHSMHDRFSFLTELAIWQGTLQIPEEFETMNFITLVNNASKLRAEAERAYADYYMREVHETPAAAIRIIRDRFRGSKELELRRLVEYFKHKEWDLEPKDMIDRMNYMHTMYFHIAKHFNLEEDVYFLSRIWRQQERPHARFEVHLADTLQDMFHEMDEREKEQNQIIVIVAAIIALAITTVAIAIYAVYPLLWM